MKVLLTTLNAKYTHHNLALRYLRAYCEQDFPQLTAVEYNINQQLSLIFFRISGPKPRCFGVFLLHLEH